MGAGHSSASSGSEDAAGLGDKKDRGCISQRFSSR